MAQGGGVGAFDVVEGGEEGDFEDEGDAAGEEDAPGELSGTLIDGICVQ